uniref:Remorin C-terminal domain-containing protein n=1 Tax=Aegilops tauschii subsp. strangulata TaxID=200361 RepID=A0A453KYY6_AEGTS
LLYDGSLFWYSLVDLLLSPYLLSQMKLEKKRSFSLDRILNTLRSAQRKAQGMRDAATASQDEHLCRKAKKTSHVTKNGQIRSLSGCFTCHAF